MDRRLIIGVVLVFCCMSCFAAISPDVMTISIPTSVSYDYNHKELTVADVNELIDLRYGTAVDRMNHSVTMWFFVLGLGGASVFIYVWRTGKQHNEGADRARIDYETSQADYDSLKAKLENQKKEYAEIVGLDLSFSLVKDANFIFRQGQEKEDELIMKKLCFIEKTRSLSPDESLLKSAVLFRRAEYSEALQILEKIKNTEADRSDVLFKIGFCHQMLGQNKEAETAYLQSISIDTGNISAYTNLSKLLIDQGFPNKAIDYLQSAAAINPFHPGVMSGLMHAYMRQGDYVTASSIFEVAQNAEVDDDYLAINKICLDALAEKYDDCRQPLLDYVDQHPDRITEVLTDSDLVGLYKADSTLKKTIQGKLKAQKKDACL